MDDRGGCMNIPRAYADYRRGDADPAQMHLARVRAARRNVVLIRYAMSRGRVEHKFNQAMMGYHRPVQKAQQRSFAKPSECAAVAERIPGGAGVKREKQTRPS